MHEVLVNRLGGLSLPRKSVVRLTDRPDMTLYVYRGRKTTRQQQQIYSRTSMARTLMARLPWLFRTRSWVPWNRGWSGGAMVLGKLPVPGRPTVLITVEQGPTALAVGAGGGCLDIFILIYPFSPLSPSLWETA